MKYEDLLKTKEIKDEIINSIAEYSKKNNLNGLEIVKNIYIEIKPFSV